MNCYTIRYYYGTYEGTRVVYADDEEEAKRKLWATLRPHMTLGMAYQSCEVLSVYYHPY